MIVVKGGRYAWHRHVLLTRCRCRIHSGQQLNHGVGRDVPRSRDERQDVFQSCDREQEKKRLERAEIGWRSAESASELSHESCQFPNSPLCPKDINQLSLSTVAHIFLFLSSLQLMQTNKD